MKKIEHLNEEEVYSEAHAKELLNVKANYNKMLQELNNKLAKQVSDLAVKYMKINQTQAAQRATQQTATKTVANTGTPTTAKQTGTVITAGQPVNADGSPATKESYPDILKVKEVINEESFDTRYADSETLQDVKDYMDAENIPYIEDEDQTTLDFDKNELDQEWVDQLEEIGLEEVDDDVETDDILDVTDDEEEPEEEPTEDKEVPEDEKDLTDIHDEIDEKKVFYVKVTDADGDFIGKLYKLFDSGEWRAKIITGDSKTFEKLNYDPDYDEHDIIAFLHENYDDAELISKDEFNDHIEIPEEPTEEVEEALRGNGNILDKAKLLTHKEDEEKLDLKNESHHIPTFDDYLNEAR